MAWFDANWLYRHKITVYSSKVAANHIDFPTYIRMSDLPSDFFSDVKSDGGDIRITQADGVTQQAREITGINTGAETGELHLKASSLSSSVNTNFYLYFGNSGASEPAEDAAFGRENTWNSGYKVRCSLEENGGPYNDSTSNDNDGTAGTNAPSPVAGIMGNEQDYGGLSANEVITYANKSSLDLSGVPFTISFWINFDSFPNATNYQPFLVNAWIRPAGNDLSYLVALYHGQSQRKMRLLVNDGSNYYVESNTTFTTGQDYYVVAEYDGTYLRMYINGVADGTPNNVGSITINSLTKGITLGNGGTGDTQYDLDGTLDEFRMSSGVARGVDWTWTEYNNQKLPGDFYLIGPREEPISFIPNMKLF
jgi:hypothetical protein